MGVMVSKEGFSFKGEPFVGSYQNDPDKGKKLKIQERNEIIRRVMSLSSWGLLGLVHNASFIDNFKFPSNHIRKHQRERSKMNFSNTFHFIQHIQNIIISTCKY